jgi:hypothetical protein
VISGRLFWKSSGVRVQIHGRLLDLGCQSLASARLVAQDFDLELVIYSDEVSRGQRLKGGEPGPLSFKLPSSGQFRPGEAASGAVRSALLKAS